MQPGERTPLFESRSKILSAYGDQRVGYFYLHAGEEIAKIEAPLWVGKNETWLNALAAQCVDQAHLGGGYPVILAEAHEQAVIRGPDREMFYALMAESLLEAGLTPQRSIKQLRKRVGIL
jgi:NurA-like 5'-3' nuclease